MNQEKTIRKKIADARKQMDLGNYSRAREISTRIIGLYPDSEPGWMLHFRVIQTLGDISEIQDVVDELMRRFPDSAEAWNAHGGFAMVKDQYEEAEKSFRHALQLEPGNITAQVGIGGSYILSGQTDKALLTFELIISQDPESWQGLQGLTILYHKTGRFEDAIITGEKAVVSGVRDPQVLRFLGDAYYQTEQYQRSAKVFSRYLEIVSPGSRMLPILCPTITQADPFNHVGSGTEKRPGFIEATYYHAFSGFEQDDATESSSPVSEKDLTAVLDANPEHGYALIALAYLMQLRGERKSALETVKKAIHTEPKVEEFQIVEGIYLIDEQPQVSIEIFDQILSGSPRMSAALMGKAMALNASGNKAEGIATLRKLEKADPVLLAELIQGMSHLSRK